MKLSSLKLVGFVLALGSISGTVHAAKKSMGMSTSSGGGKEVDRDFVVTIPVMADGPQARIHAEYNVMKAVGVALEIASLGETQLVSDKTMDETGESLKTKGSQVSLLIARYSEPARLGGFFWALGAGYRQYTADWKRRPDEKSTALQLESADDGYLHHRVRGQGVLGHARVGYRWVAGEWPVAIGGHIGLRHLNSSVKDIEVDAEQQKELNMTYSSTNSYEQKELKNRVMTTPDISIEIGMAL